MKAAKPLQFTQHLCLDIISRDYVETPKLNTKQMRFGAKWWAQGLKWKGASLSAHLAKWFTEQPVSGSAQGVCQVNLYYNVQIIITPL